MDIKKVRIADSENLKRYEERLVIAGKLDEHTTISDNGSIKIASPETFHALLELSQEKLLEFGDLYSYNQPEECYPFTLSTDMMLKSPTNGFSCLNVALNINSFEWNQPYSIAELTSYYSAFCENIRGVKFIIARDSDEVPTIYFTCSNIHMKKPIKKYFNLCMQTLRDAHSYACITFEKRPEEGLTSVFCFPPEIKMACNQYLLYFGQFLEDLGIPADTSIKEEMERVLFTVLPKNKDQALEVIHQALTVYLQAPHSGFADDLQDSPIALYQWKANIHHLKSQIELARALLQAKDATIQALELTTYRLQDQIHHIEASSSGSEPSPGSEEVILGGALSITKFKAKGFTINLPYILRKLKRK